jgi:hypothetical protein
VSTEANKLFYTCPTGHIKSPSPTRVKTKHLLSQEMYFMAMYIFELYQPLMADRSGRAVYGMNCLCSLERLNHGFELHSRHGCLCVRLFCVCVVLCLGSGLATGRSLIQGVLPSVKNDYKTEEEVRAQQKSLESLMNESATNESS